MIDAPKTIEEARATRYGACGAYDATHCAEAVPPRKHNPDNIGQCARAPGYGPGSLYCREHAMQYASASATWWRVNKLNGAHGPVRVIAHTDMFVVLEGGRKVRCVGEYEDYYPTFAEARTASLVRARREYDEARERLAKIEAWTEPTEADDAR